MDKEQLSVDDLSEQRPINQKWSWDRILRSIFIKQADVLQGLYFFWDDFSLETHHAITNSTSRKQFMNRAFHRVFTPSLLRA